MPTRRCCCGPCLTFTDVFDRADNDDIGPDYEECSGNFEILSNELVGTGSLVLLKSKGVPYGYLAVGMSVIEGVTYELGAYRGTSGTPCYGSSTVILEIQCLAPTGTNQARIRMELHGGTDKGWVDYETATWTTDDTLYLILCIGKDGVIAGRPPADDGWVITDQEDTDFLDPLTDCSGTLPSNLYFEISASGTEDGVIREISYSEHFDAFRNPDCRRCLFGTCFGYGDVPIGWTMTLSGITEVDCVDASCPSSISADVYIEDIDHPCSAAFQSEVVVIPTDCPLAVIPPEDASFQMWWELDCTDPDEMVITWWVSSSLGAVFSITKHYPKAAGVSLTRAVDLKFYSQPSDGAVDCSTAACCIDGTLTVEPIVLEGCCYDPAEP